MLKNLATPIFKILKKFSSKRLKPVTANNNTWHQYRSDANTTIIFIHGFLSDSDSCWRSKSGKFWPDIIRSDSRLNNPNIFLGGYHTSHDSGIYKFQDCAEELIRALERPDREGRPAPLSSSNVIFVCHSLGGVIARYFMEAHTNKFKSKAVGILLMASPSIGSEYADTLSGIAKFYKNEVGKQLQYMNEALTDLDRRFKILIDEKRIQNFVGAEAIEHHAIYKIPFFHGMKNVVTQESASRYFGNSQILAKTNHSTIVKPEDANDYAHLFLYDFYIKKFQPIEIKPKETSLIVRPAGLIEQQEIHSPTTSTSQILFDIYNPECAPYYLDRSIDCDLINTLSLYSIWVFGPSGCGKTSAIRRLIHKNKSSPLEICLSSCYGNLSNNRIIEEISITAQQKNGALNFDRHNSISNLTTLLAKHSKHSPIVLYIDEVPVQAEDEVGLNNLVHVISTLLDSVKHATGNAHIRFVISSIHGPKLHTATNGSKFAEQMRLMSISTWPDHELEKLLTSLLRHLNLPDLENSEKKDLVDASAGLPRFIKAYLRNRVITPETSFQDLIQITTKQIVI